ncbi:hypothetical protein BOTBODRAFT_58724 [Botryobasidium botryosum FD-172 SS1]|uniref:Heterokaryon incompatibility domain-containing protein n=1 Tax=Botryobasidium botryosum (strain FD-172 SS1) TaxID=930990 RepID=A0A067M1G2_BOTB1|nr:hypothetical protein BOTBODRAFT_58724 [Botryobasidium botryosum FD-172 SS1]
MLDVAQLSTAKIQETIKPSLGSANMIESGSAVPQDGSNIAGLDATIEDVSIVSEEGSAATDEGDLKLIFSKPLNSLRGCTLDITSYASEERYRFIDCSAFVERDTLQIVETTTLSFGYTAISYVWGGLDADPEMLRKDGSFHVYCGVRSDGTLREDGGPISFKALGYACRWSLGVSAKYLWLDRVCIMQTSRVDKNWQITRMYDVYESCTECVILPGGLQRLASVFEETTWASRAWTFQESIVTWRYAVVFTSDWHDARAAHWLIPGECHWQYLTDMLIESEHLLRPPLDEALNKDFKPCLIFGRDGAALSNLARTMEYLAYNEICEEGEETISEHNIHQLLLQSVQPRISSRPVDMVFSIMGLVGVSLQSERFDETDRFHATLALVDAMLREDTESDGGNTLIDIPLWAYPEAIAELVEGELPREETGSSTGFPDLQELAAMMDLSEHPQQSAGRAHSKLKILPSNYDADLTEDSPEEHATALAHKIPSSYMLDAYHGGQRVIFRHEEEGIIELCRTIDIKAQRTDGESWHLQTLADLVVFGWSIRAEGHPALRVYKFDISALFE